MVKPITIPLKPCWMRVGILIIFQGTRSRKCATKRNYLRYTMPWCPTIWIRYVAVRSKPEFQPPELIVVIFGEYRNFGKKSKFCAKIEISVENRNFGEKSKFCSKIEILLKNRNFGRKSKFRSKIEILVENRNFGRKSKFWSKIDFGRKLKFC